MVYTNVHRHSEPVTLLYPAASKGALCDIIGEVLCDLPDVVDESKVEQEIFGILALVTTQCAHSRRGPENGQLE